MDCLCWHKMSEPLQFSVVGFWLDSLTSCLCSFWYIDSLWGWLPWNCLHLCLIISSPQVYICLFHQCVRLSAFRQFPHVCIIVFLWLCYDCVLPVFGISFFFAFFVLVPEPSAFVYWPWTANKPFPHLSIYGLLCGSQFVCLYLTSGIHSVKV